MSSSPKYSIFVFYCFFCPVVVGALSRLENCAVEAAAEVKKKMTVLVPVQSQRSPTGTHGVVGLHDSKVLIL